MPGRRVIVHAGFHKTGSTTVQSFLQANTKHLWKRCRLLLPRHIRHNAARMAARYSRFKRPALLDAYADDLRSAFTKLNLDASHKVLISEENLSGRMPGRDGQLTYDAAPMLMARTEDVICEFFGPETEVIFHFITRDPDDWLRSTYKHNLSKTRLTMDQTTFFETHRPATDFKALINEVQNHVTGAVETSDLSEFSGPEGPAQPLIDLVKLPPHRRAALLPSVSKNVGPSDDLVAALLDLNRSTLPDDALVTAKNELLSKDATNDG